MTKGYCRFCKENKVRIRGKKSTELPPYFYLDETGRKWNGAKCPDCVQERNRLNRAKRNDRSVWK